MIWFIKFWFIWLFLIILVLNPIWFYVYNKTSWKNSSDCMLNYVNNSYPIGYIYNSRGNTHIDKKRSDMQLIWKVNWCTIKTDNMLFDINNSIYCYYTLFFEKIWKKFYS